MIWTLIFACSSASKIDSSDVSSDTSSVDVPTDTAQNDTSIPEPTSEPTSEPNAPTECVNEILYVTPGDQEEGVLYRSAIEIGLLEAESSAFIKLIKDGSDVEGESNSADKIISFIPTTPLHPNSSYTIEAHYCNDQIFSSVFTTGALGSPVESNLTGQTYVFDLREGTWDQPVGAGALLVNFIEADILMGIENHTGTNIDPLLTVAEVDSSEQDMCFPTIGGVVDVNFTQNPFFEIEPVDVNISISGYPLNVQQFELSGIFQADGLGFEHGHLFGYIDARTLESVTSFTAPQICSLLEGFGAACQTCGDGQDYCFTLEVSNLSGVATSQPLTCVMLSNCHPLCNSSQCNNTNLGICP